MLSALFARTKSEHQKNRPFFAGADFQLMREKISSLRKEEAEKALCKDYLIVCVVVHTYIYSSILLLDIKIENRIKKKPTRYKSVFSGDPTGSRTPATRMKTWRPNH